VIQSTSGEHFLIGSHAVRFIAEQTVETSKATWSKLVNKYDCLKPSKDFQEAGNCTDWAFHYKTKAGQTTVALRIPGIEFVVQNMSGQKASDNREKFLQLIADWKQQQDRVLGKRNATSAPDLAGPKQARLGLDTDFQESQLALLTQIKDSNASAADDFKNELLAVSTEVKLSNQCVQHGFANVGLELVKAGVCMQGKLDDGMQGMTSKLEDCMHGMTSKLEDGMQGMSSKLEDGMSGMSSKLEDGMQGMSSKLEDGMLAVSAEVVTVSAEVRLFNVGVAAANEELIRTLRERDAKINGQTYIIKKLNADNTKLHADNAKIHEDLERTTTQIGNVFAQNAKLRGEVLEVKVALHEMRTNAEESADQHMVALLELKASNQSTLQEIKGLLINLVAGPGT